MVEALEAFWSGPAGRGCRVGLDRPDGPLGDLDRVAVSRRVPGVDTVVGLRWAWRDVFTRAWYPQGITTSADSGRCTSPVVLVSWYAPRTRAGRDRGARLSVLDLSDPSRVRYRHVLLVRAVRDEVRAGPRLEPVRIHAGGLAWYGDLVYVAATLGGLRVFDLRDLMRVPTGEQAAVFGYRYVLPERSTYSARLPPPASDLRRTGRSSDRTVGNPTPMRYSFVSVDRTSTPHCLVAGEYTRGDVPARIVRLALDEVTGQLSTQPDGRVTPSYVVTVPVLGLQGIASVDGGYLGSTSAGPWRRGDLWLGHPRSGLQRRRRTLPVGPEDVAVDIDRGLLWSLTEWPGRRYVFALPLPR